MGYPMTWQRVVNRNALLDGDYGKPPARWARNVNLTDRGLATEEQFLPMVAQSGRERVERYEQQIRALAGDLRRLEADTVDENGICGHIARQTGLDRDDVAAVLKAYIEH